MSGKELEEQYVLKLKTEIERLRAEISNWQAVAERAERQAALAEAKLQEVRQWYLDADSIAVFYGPEEFQDA